MKAISISMIALLAATTAHAAATTEQWNFKGNGADAWFGSYDECSSTSAGLWVTQQRQLGPNAWGGQYGYVYVDHYDWCNNNSSGAYIDLATATLTSGGARGARVVASGTTTVAELLGCTLVDGPEECWSECWIDENGVEQCQEYCWDGDYWSCEYQYVDVPYNIDLTWAPTDSYRGVSTQQGKGDGWVSRTRITGSTGYGPVSGVLSFDGYEFTEGSWGSCWNATSGTSWIYHYN